MLQVPDDEDRPQALRCACGGAHGPSASEHAIEHAVSNSVDPGDLISSHVESSLVKALFPQAALRRRFLQAVGRRTALAAIRSVLPLASLQAMAQEPAPLEKRELKIGFLPITCATPLIMALPLGFYAAQGLTVDLVRTPGMPMIGERILDSSYDATHFLCPMPLAMTLGVGYKATPMVVATAQNTNGQAITLAMRHKNRRDPRTWKGMRLAIPFLHSMHNYLLRYYLAEAGLDPDRDVQISVVLPPNLVGALRDGSIDGFLGPDPMNQRAVYEDLGFIHLLSKDIWDGHPCCAFGSRAEFVRSNPNTFAALTRAVLVAAAMAQEARHRDLISTVIAPLNYLNQPEAVIRQVLTGRFLDGLGNVRVVPDRLNFQPLPWQSTAVWILTQMRRWGYIKQDIDYRQIADQVMLLTDARTQMRRLRQAEPSVEEYTSFTVMGKRFDSARARDYERSFAIRRAD